MTEGNKDNQYLKVLEAYTRDVGRGVARIDYDTMDSLTASTGDIIEIKGKRIEIHIILNQDNFLYGRSQPLSLQGVRNSC
jgi:hypothetical protein